MLRLRMEAAAEALDFEEAKGCGAESALCGVVHHPQRRRTPDMLGLTRQGPGAMGLGTSQQRVQPPLGWKPPPKPDLLTRGGGSRRR